MDTVTREPTGNHILDSLPGGEVAALRPKLRRTTVGRGQELYAPGAPIRELYFPVSGLVSMVATLRSGRSIEVGTIGREGVTGLPMYRGSKNLPYQVGGQIAGEGYALAADDYFSLHAGSPSFRSAIERYIHVLMTMMAQTAACNGAHDVIQRLAKWLLISHDAAAGPDLPLTQEYLAIMIGVQRPTVTLAAGELQRLGLLSYRRGKIHLHDREAIAKRSCECYGAIRAEIDALRQTATPPAFAATTFAPALPAQGLAAD